MLQQEGMDLSCSQDECITAIAAAAAVAAAAAAAVAGAVVLVALALVTHYRNHILLWCVRLDGKSLQDLESGSSQWVTQHAVPCTFGWGAAHALLCMQSACSLRVDWVLLQCLLLCGACMGVLQSKGSGEQL
jgi:hypothetical protein